MVKISNSLSLVFPKSVSNLKLAQIENRVAYKECVIRVPSFLDNMASRCRNIDKYKCFYLRIKAIGGDQGQHFKFLSSCHILMQGRSQEFGESGASPERSEGKRATRSALSE